MHSTAHGNKSTSPHHNKIHVSPHPMAQQDITRCGGAAHQTPAAELDGKHVIKQVAAGAQHAVALLGDGSLVAWGAKGQCAVPA